MIRSALLSLALVSLVLPVAAQAGEEPHREGPWLKHVEQMLHPAMGRGRIGVQIQSMTPELRVLCPSQFFARGPPVCRKIPISMRFPCRTARAARSDMLIGVMRFNTISFSGLS